MRLHETPFFFQPEGWKRLSESRDYGAVYVDGIWVAPVSGRLYDIYDPATGARIGSAPDACVDDMEHAIAAAHRAFHTGPWPRMPMQERATCLRRLIDWLQSRSAEIAGLVTAEVGAPIALANGMHVAMALDQMETAIDIALRLRPQAIEPILIAMPDGMGGGKTIGTSFGLYEPVGVTALFSAYNFPFLLNGVKIIPALIAGNTAVVKAPPQTPLETLIFAEAAEAVDLPPGVFNIITGRDIAPAAMLSADPRIDLVSFTGSDAVGSRIMAQAASTTKRLLMELGGKSALIVRADADLDLAAAIGLSSMTIQAGQGCSLPTRHLVHESHLDDYIDRLTRLADAVVIGDPADPHVSMGPLISAAQRDRVERFVAEALAQGGKVHFGGKRPVLATDGYYFEPTLIGNVGNDWPIAQEEIFGPVAIVIPFRTDDEAVAMANDSPYGLSGQIVSRDVGRAVELAGQLRTGEVIINGGAGAASPFAPFGGTRRSGFGRQNGEQGVIEYMNLKVVHLKGA